MMGELMLRLPSSDPTAAEARFGHAAATARKQRAKLWELRAATSLARLWREQHRSGEVHDLLTPSIASSLRALGQRIYKRPEQYFERPLPAPSRTTQSQTSQVNSAHEHGSWPSTWTEFRRFSVVA